MPIIPESRLKKMKKNPNVEFVECPVCHREFPRSSKPRGRSPSGVRPYKCSTCTKPCARRLTQINNSKRQNEKRN